jgi:hypothetical protein
MMNLQDWYSNPETHQELQRLLGTSVLRGAVDLLQQRARVPQLRTTDLNELALQHAIASGYQKALDDLVALAQIPVAKKLPKLPKHWEAAENP